MTIQEAVQLSSRQAPWGRGETFLLRMGEPVRIIDLARNLIELSGLEPERDIPIVFTGLRPGRSFTKSCKRSTKKRSPRRTRNHGADGVERSTKAAGARCPRCSGRSRWCSEEAMRLLRLLVPDYTPLISIATVRPANIVDITDKNKKRFDANV